MSYHYHLTPYNVLEGEVKNQSNQEWAYPHATGGGQQTVVDPNQPIEMKFWTKE